MSLLDTASEWNHKPTKKRTPMLKRPVNRFDRLKEGMTSNEGVVKADVKASDRNQRVHNILNKMAQSNDEEDNADSLANFEPLPNPNLQIKQDFPPIEENGIKYNPNHHEAFSNYNHAYDGQTTYNSKEQMQGNATTPSQRAQLSHINSDKIMEKINYMIHMLEQQQHEKTENITEEFILYSFLGIFVIYVCDSFSRGGKYIR
jgi:hypothetical protein